MKNIISIYKKWIILAFLFFVAAIVLLVIGIVKDDEKSRSSIVNVSITSEDTTSPYITFNMNYAQVGKELVAQVNNFDLDYPHTTQWYVDNSKVDGATEDTYTPTKNDKEKFISYCVTYDSYSKISGSLYCSDLPVVYITTDNNLAIGDTYVTARMATSGNSNYTTDNTKFFYGDINIKLRGNSTKNLDKHPYKIALSKATNLYQMGKSKHWVLLANAIDHSLIRNKLVNDFSGDLGMEYMASTNVVLIINNSYEGVYQLCEQIRVDEDRVNIQNWKDTATNAASLIATIKKETEGMTGAAATVFAEGLADAMKKDLSWLSSPYEFKYQNNTYKITDYIDLPALTGGFLLEMDFYNFNNVSSVATKFNQPLYFNTPEPEVAVTNPELIDYAKKMVQSFEYALHSYDFTFHNSVTKYLGGGTKYDNELGWQGNTIETTYDDPSRDGFHYTQIFDIDNLVNNWIVCEFTLNWDSMKNSMFVSKDIDKLAEISPEWDFDWAFGNNNMYSIATNFPETWHTTNNYFTNEQYYQSVQWNRYLIKDPYFLFKAYSKYKEIRPTLIEDMIKNGGTLDTYTSELLDAAKANDARWSYTYAKYQGEEFEDSMKSLKSFIKTRINWLDKQFTSFDTFVKSLGYYEASDSINVTSASSTDGVIKINVKDNNISKVRVQVNGAAFMDDVAVSGGYATVTVPADKLSAEGTNVVNVTALNSSGDFITTGSSKTATGNNVELLKPVWNYKVY